jgi:hypothetical protein
MQIRERKWKWLGDTLRKPEGAIEKEALEWNPQGARRRGRPEKRGEGQSRGRRRKLGKPGWS